MAKQQPDIVIDRLGTHLFKVTRKDGTNWLSWDWNKLLKEVQIATDGLAPAKKDLVKETEAKVTKARAKKTNETKSPATAEAKKPAAKKAVAKKPVAKKTKND